MAHIFVCVICLSADFLCSVIEFGAISDFNLRRTIGGHTRSRSCVMLSFIIGDNILIWYGAVIVLGVRQSGENLSQ